jgi:hypothetical protein
MGVVVSLADFRKPVPAVVDELAEVIALLKPADDWWTGRMQMQLADAYRNVADYRRILVAKKFGRESREHATAKEQLAKAFDTWRTVCLKQIFIPAPTVGALRQKQEWVARNHGEECPEIRLALARDEAALASRFAGVARQQAGKARAKAARAEAVRS